LSPPPSSDAPKEVSCGGNEANKTVIGRVKAVIRYAPVRNEAYLSTKPLLLSSDLAD
jgi:hypothetical protein